MMNLITIITAACISLLRCDILPVTWRGTVSCSSLMPTTTSQRYIPESLDRRPVSTKLALYRFSGYPGKVTRPWKAFFTLIIFSLATRIDCCFCRPSGPRWPQSLVHLMRGGSFEGLWLRVKTHGKRAEPETGSWTRWWVTLRMFTTASQLTMPENREINDKTDQIHD